jgi:calcineurin-like phosphoesterase family protein
MRFKTIKLNIEDQNIFFTSDLHLQHKNIIKYCERPFENINQMNITIMDNWNSLVSENDVVFILGDFCFGDVSTWCYLLDRLKGKKYLILGNHDKSVPENKFVNVQPLMNVLIMGDGEIPEGQRISLCHYPMVSWYQSHRGSWQLFGHHHSLKSNKPSILNGISPNQYDVGVDGNDFLPISYEAIKTIITKQNLKI